MLKWILSKVWPFIVLILGYVAVVANTRKTVKTETKVKDLEKTVEKAKELQNVQVSTTRSVAVERLRKSGKLRD